MRVKAAVAAGLVGPLVLALALQGSVLPSEWSVQLLWGGVILLVVAIGLAAAPRIRTEGSGSTAVARIDAKNVAGRDINIVTEPTAAAPSPAEIEIRRFGNTATEPWVRWYHLEARALTDVIADGAIVAVRVRGQAPAWQTWRWEGAAEFAQIRRAGVRIPLVVGGTRNNPSVISTGWFVGRGNWYLTPLVHTTLGAYMRFFAPNARQVFDARVSWNSAGIEHAVEASFELRFWSEPESGARLLRIGDAPTLEDQMGGLTELRSKGVALRNQGMQLVPGSADSWLQDVAAWAEQVFELIGEVSASDANFFHILNQFTPVEFQNVAFYSNEHRLGLQILNEQISRLQQFMRVGEI